MNINNIRKELDNLMGNFRGCFINTRFELILVPRHNIYFMLEDVESVEDLNRKILAWVSRAATKGVPIQTQKKIRKGLNEYFGIQFSEDDWDQIYTRLGNGCNENLCREFVRNGYDLNILRRSK